MKKKATVRIPRNFCFACGNDNTQGMRLKFTIDPEGLQVRGVFVIAHRYQGPPKGVHGGIVATIVDEAMGKLSRLEGVIALTAEMTVEYLQIVPLGRKIFVEARPLERNGRNYWRECTIRDARGKILVRGKGRFVKVADRKPTLDYE
ncbi:MAG: hypothetical protein A3H27_00250 [Acidobacteria bacterium RIFCSPLOWO2_02_FULL_59_13]|nr:MAG: hypothetical protein A3H27_00250 [Acidobacteria bacterium RIFCSPLOWO2_02_FULL_59_13]